MNSNHTKVGKVKQNLTELHDTFHKIKKNVRDLNMMTDKDLNNMILNPGAWSQVEMVHDDLLVCRIPTKGKAPPCRLSLKYQNLRGDD
jgi:hypothetical protein